MDLRHLLTFRAVVDRGSFSAAAEELGISQPAVSAQIRSLEERVGERLLDRHGRGASLTEAGRILDTYARRMIALEEELDRELGETSERVSGQLIIGSSTGPGEVLLPPVLGDFRRRHPDVGVSLIVSDTRSICQQVVDGELELGIVGSDRPQRGLVVTPFISDELIVITPPDHPLAREASIDLATFVKHPVILQQRGSGVRDVLEQAIRAAGLRPSDLTVEMELGLQQSVKAAVMGGYGITVTSRRSVEPELADGRLAGIVVAGSDLRRDFATVRAVGRTPSRVTQAFLEFAAPRLGANGDQV